MKPGLRCFSALILLIITGCCAPSTTADDIFIVQFELYAPGITVKPFLAGSSIALREWRPDGVVLEPIGDDTYRGSFQVPAVEVECKLTLGSWATEALDVDGFLRTNRILQIASDTLLRDTVFAWNEGTATSRTFGQVTGYVKELGELPIQDLIPRNIWAWSPDDGQEVTAVLLMNDGRNLFDPTLSNFGVDWGVDEVATGLLEDGISIAILGIDCTEDRFSEYSWTRNGRSYVKWLASEGKKLAISQFNCAGNVQFYVAGSSMGGLISLIALSQYPDAFDGAICMSPAFAYKGFDYSEVLADQELSFTHRPVWIDNGTVGLETELQPGIDRMIKLLDAGGACMKIKIYRGASHFEADWGERLAEAFTWVNRQACSGNH